jgi:chromosome segregation and condensation protein ScpB
MIPQEIKPIVESLLFAAGAPVALRRLAEVIGVTQAEVKAALALLQEEYAAQGAVFFLPKQQVAINCGPLPESAEYVKTLIREKLQTA